ncbi:MAG: alpha/beta fold hydrolase [Planctomycetota bacterium]|nr:MAG: alpha/beta fold hydrolase [Planctomycetota bacterium]REK26135.1 MAG: alpha/beta fold hydrolase [Planctomycetota bacterium]REK33505.1 MAG: alpha/beta fold hydrolase [Planctomycetota bacterium]
MPTVSIGDVRLNVVEEGSGRPLLFVHGFPLDHTMWRAQIEHFANTHRVIAPDLRGFGGSDVTEGTVGMEQFADDLGALLTELEVTEPVSFCGLSMGGYIAWQFFERHRDRLGSLILCDTRAEADTEEAQSTRHGLAAKVLKEGPDFIARTMPAKLFSTRTREERPDIVDTVQAVIRSTSSAGIAAAARGMAERPDATGLLPQIDLPALLIVGEEDAISTVDEMLEIATRMPAAEFKVIEAAGHMAPLEDPAAVNSAIETFLLDNAY